MRQDSKYRKRETQPEKSISEEKNEDISSTPFDEEILDGFIFQPNYKTSLPFKSFTKILEEISENRSLAVKRMKILELIKEILNEKYGHTREDAIEDILNIFRLLSFRFLHPQSSEYQVLHNVLKQFNIEEETARI